MTKEEITGRFMLWEMAVSEAQSCLKTAKRALEGSKQSFQKDEQKKYQEQLQEFIKTRDDYKEGTITSTQLNEYNDKYNRPFPYLAECFALHRACLNLAIIYFCQIFNTGYGNEAAAKNTKQFREEYLDIVLQRIFPTNKEMGKFNKLLEQLMQVRDGMIGHADAGTLNIEHKEFVTTIGGPQNITRSIDMNFWLSFMEPLRRGILEYMNEIKKNFA